MAEEQEQAVNLDSTFNIAVATFAVLSRRFGKAFAEEVREEIRQQAEALAKSDNPDVRADAVGMLQVANSELLRGIIEASPEVGDSRDGG